MMEELKPTIVNRTTLGTRKKKSDTDPKDGVPEKRTIPHVIRERERETCIERRSGADAPSDMYARSWKETKREKRDRGGACRGVGEGHQ